MKNSGEGYKIVLAWFYLKSKWALSFQEIAVVIDVWGIILENEVCTSKFKVT